MVGRRIGPGVLAAVSAVAAAASACTPNSQQACAGWGVESEISLMFLQEGYTGLAGASYELCARGRCTDGELKQEDLTRVHLRLPEDADPHSGPVRFRVTRRGSDSPVIDASSDVRLTYQSDNCGGGAYNRSLAFTKADGLTTKIPPSVTAAWRHQAEAPDSPSPSA